MKLIQKVRESVILTEIDKCHGIEDGPIPAICECLFSHILISSYQIKKIFTSFHSDMDGPRDCHTAWSTADTERQIPYNIAHVWDRKRAQANLFTRQSRVSNVESKHGWQEVRGRGRLGLIYAHYCINAWLTRAECVARGPLLGVLYWPLWGESLPRRLAVLWATLGKWGPWCRPPGMIDRLINAYLYFLLPDCLSLNSAVMDPPTPHPHRAQGIFDRVGTKSVFRKNSSVFSLLEGCL